MACSPKTDPVAMRVIAALGGAEEDSRCRRSGSGMAEEIVRKLRDAMLAAGKDLAAVLQALEISEATLNRWRSQYGGMKSEEAKWLKHLEDENARLKKLVAEQALDLSMLKEVAAKDW